MFLSFEDGRFDPYVEMENVRARIISSLVALHILQQPIRSLSGLAVNVNQLILILVLRSELLVRHLLLISLLQSPSISLACGQFLSHRGLRMATKAFKEGSESVKIYRYKEKEANVFS